jgi:PAS domain S-box-containing protein
MSKPLEQPAFGAADLTNCERELIHLAGSIQPHGALLVLSEPLHIVVQASANTESYLGVAPSDLFGRTLSSLGGDLAEQLTQVVREHELDVAFPLACTIAPGGSMRWCTTLVHRVRGTGLVVEFESVTEQRPNRVTPSLAPRLTAAISHFSAAHSLPALGDAVVQELRALTGYDRVMVYKFDQDGHGEILAEAREAHLEAFLGRHYPASDIPERARDLYLRNRIRVLADVHYEPVPLVTADPAIRPDSLDMSLCVLRSMSPMHLQYLRNMGVTATLVASLVHEGRLWGLIACHHYTPKPVTGEIRAACELLAEVISTRISALEHYAEAQAEVLVRRLEHRVIEATATGVDWREALFDNPRHLLQPLDATGAALIHDGELTTAGEVPSTPELRALFAWIAGRAADPVFHCASIARTNAALAALTPTASGVLAIELSRETGDYLAWFRKEQLHNVTWGGDPAKPAVPSDDPLELSPRRSFAAWHELVRETARPWTQTEVGLARAICTSLSDILLQIRSVRVLIAEHQLMRFRRSVEASSDPVVIADANGQVLLRSAAMDALIRGPHRSWQSLQDLVPHFSEPERISGVFRTLRTERRPWRGELRLVRAEGETMPVAVRADIVPGAGGSILGYILIMTDLTARKEAELTRLQLQQAIFRAQQPSDLLPTGAGRGSPEVRALVTAIWANAGVAVSEIADAVTTSSVAPLLREVEDATRHAAHLSALLDRYSGPTQQTAD